MATEVEVNDTTVRRLGTVKPGGVVFPGGIGFTGEEPVGVVNLFTGEFISVEELETLSRPTDDEARQILRDVNVPEDEIEKIIAQSKLDLTAEGWLDEWKSINPSFRKDFSYSVGARSVSAGLGDVVSAFGGLAGWAKQEKLRENLLEIAEVLQSSAPEHIGWSGPETLIDPRFWQTTVLRTGTLSVALIPGALAAAYLAAPVAGFVGLGAMGTTMLTIIFGAAGRGVTEAAIESGSVYNEALVTGLSEEEASRAAGSVFWKNAGLLTALSIPEFAFAFGVNPFSGAVSRMTRSGLVRVVRGVSGRLVPVLTEAGQEFAQDIFNRQALGRDIVWDDEAKLAVVLGGILGGAVSFSGAAVQTIQNRTKARLTPDLQKVFDDEKVRLESENLAPEGSDLRAMDAVAETEEGKALIEEVTEEYVQEENEKLAGSTDTAEDLAVKHQLEVQRELIEEVTTIEPTEAVTPVTEPVVGAEVSETAAVETIQQELALSEEQVRETRRVVLREIEAEARQIAGGIEQELIDANNGKGFIENVSKERLLELIPEPLRIPNVDFTFTRVFSAEDRVIMEKMANLTLSRLQSDGRPIPPIVHFKTERLISSLAGAKSRNNPSAGEAHIIFNSQSFEGLGTSVNDRIGQLAHELVHSTQEFEGKTSRAGLEQRARDIKVEPQPTVTPEVPTEPVVGAEVTPEVPAEPVEGIPFVTTKQVEVELRTKGFTQSEINKFTPQQARDILAVDTTLPATIPPDIPSEAVNNIVADVSGVPMVNDATLSRFRPAWRVFDEMGIFEVFEATLKADVLVQEGQVQVNKDLKAFIKDIKKEHKDIGEAVKLDKARRALIYESVNNNNQEAFNQLTFQEKRFANWWRKTADDWANKLNIPQSERIKNYITHIFDDAARQGSELSLDPAIASVLSDKIADRVKMPFLEKRLGKEIGLIRDPFLSAEAYINAALRTFYYTPMLEKIKFIAEDANTPESARRFLTEYSKRMTGEYHAIDKEINKDLVLLAKSLSRIPGMEKLATLLERGNPVGAAAYNLSSSLYTLWLGFKPTTAIRNLSQHGLIIAEVNRIDDFAEGIKLRFTKEGRAAIDKSLVWRSRRGAFIEGIDSSLGEQWADDFREVALFLFRKADEQNVKDAFLAGYSEAKRLFPEQGESLWIRRGDEVAMRTQFLYTKMGSMEITRSAPGRAASMLTTWMVNWFELMNQWARGKESTVYKSLPEEVRTPAINLVRQSDGSFAIPEKKWFEVRKSILIYATLVGLAWALDRQDWNRVRTFEYVGVTSIGRFADLISGEFPALQLPGALVNVVAGFMLNDERRLKSGVSTLKRAFSFANQVEGVLTGDKDFNTLFFYLKGKDFKVRKLEDGWEDNWKPYDDLVDPLVRAKQFPGLNRNTAQKRWREQNPLIEAQMFIVNRLGTLSSDEARAEALRLIDKHNIDTDLIEGYEKIFGVDTNEELGKLQRLVGTVNVKEIGKDVTYFTTSNFLTELNAIVKTNGRSKVERDGHAFSSLLRFSN